MGPLGRETNSQGHQARAGEGTRKRQQSLRQAGKAPGQLKLTGMFPPLFAGALGPQGGEARETSRDADFHWGARDDGRMGDARSFFSRVVPGLGGGHFASFFPSLRGRLAFFPFLGTG